MPEGLEPLSAEALGDVSAAGPASAALGGFNEALAKASAATAGEGEPGEQYAALAAAAEEAAGHLGDAGAEGVPAQLLAENHKALKKLTKDYLSGLGPEELQALAAAQGFEHPSLVGLNVADGGAHPLVHWLDPSYGPESPSKLAIQAKANERFAALAAGDTIGGLTLADVQAAEAMQAPGAAGGWQASPADIVKASAGLHQALADFEPHKVNSQGVDGGLGALVEAENHLATAQCAQLGADLDVAKASAKASVDKALQGLVGSHRMWAVGQVVAGAQASGAVGEAEAKWLSATDQLALLRSSTSPEERAGLKDLATKRAGELAELAQLKAAHGAAGGPLGLPGIDGPQGKVALEGFAAGAATYFAKANAAAKWSAQVASNAEATALSGSVWANQAQQSQLTTDFRAWAKTQKLADLRAVASTMGMETAGASRAHVQNYIASSWDPGLDKTSIAAAAAAAANKAAVPKPIAPQPAAPKSPGAAAGPVPSPATTKPAGPPSAKSFTSKHLQIVETLKAHQAVTADLPPRPPAEEVEGWSFGPPTAANLGGGHTKSLHAAPDGSMWMFKPDKTAAGARAHAEAKASEIFSRVGVPSVAVYARKIDGKMGSIQPLVKGATTLSADPKSWSQSDVDNLVRYHVAAWAVGDHDGNPANVIRTPSGGLCPVDQGQAFKFYGRDKLSTDYHPNDSYGSVPVFHQAYAAAKTASLASGVAIRPEAALPTIKAFEAMPESQYRAILAPVASEGVAHGVHWVEPMRKAAQKRLGKAQVSNPEVAEEFLRTAVERKNGLRSAFASFFTSNGFGAGAKLEKVA